MHCRRYFAEAFFVRNVAVMSDEELKELPERGGTAIGRSA